MQRKRVARAVNTHPLDVDSAVRYVMAKRNISRRHFVAKTGIAPSTMDKIRRGESIRTDIIVRIAEALGYTPLAFLMLSEERWITVATSGSNGQ